MANSGKLSIAAQDELKKLLGQQKNEKSLVTGQSLIDAGRMNVIRDLSQKEASRIVGAVEKEEQRVAKLLQQASENEPLLKLIKFYSNELQSIYYDSTQVTESPIGGNKPIEKEFLPRLKLIIRKIKNDKILTEFKQVGPLLDLANKIKQKLTERTTRMGKLKDTASRFIKSDITAGVLAGAATKSPFAALAVFAYKNRPKKNEYARRADLRSKYQDIKTAQTEAQGGYSVADHKTKLGKEVEGSKSDAQDASSLAVAGGAGAAASLGGEDTGQIVKILNQHTDLLGKIYGVNAKALKLQEDQLAKQAAAAEEAALETQDATASKLTDGSASGEEEEEKEKGGGLLSSVMNIMSNFMGGRVGKIFKLFKGGPKGLMGRLGNSALSRVASSRIGGAVLSKVGMGAASAAGATAAAGAATTATRVASTLGDDVAVAAAKGAGKTGAKGGLKAFIKKIVPKQVAKLAGKSIPFLGAGLAAGFAAWKLLKGDAKGAALEAAAAIPGAGILASIASMARDIYHDFYGVQPEDDPEAGARLTEVKGEVQNAANEELEKLGLKGKKENDQKEQKAEQQDAANQQKADQIDQQKSGGNAPAPSSSASAGGENPAPTTPPAPPAPKPSFLSRLVRNSLAVATMGQSEVALAAYKKLTSTATPEGGPSGGAGASGSFDGDPTQVLAFGGESGQLQNFKGLHPTIQNKVIKAGQEYNQRTGKKLKVNSAKRDPAKQRQLWDESVRAGRPGRGPSGMAIAKPGRSRHERGLAIDIQNYREPAAVAALNSQGLFQGVPGDPVHFQLDGNPSLDQLDQSASQETAVAGNTPATASVSEATPAAGAPSGTGPSSAPTAAPSGDTTAQGRAAISSGIYAPAAPISGGGAGGGNTTVIQGGNTMMGGGGGGSAAQIIPAPIDREPTIRRILDGSLS